MATITNKSLFPRTSCCGIRSRNGVQMISSFQTIQTNSKSFRRSFCGIKSQHSFQKISSSWTMKMDSKSSNKRENEKNPLEIPELHISQLETSSSPSNLQFDRLQLDTEISPENKIEFGHFMAREALLDEEYWTAAWLRAESNWENKTHERYANNYQRKFAEEEFNALKRRRKAQLGQKCTCVVAVRKEDKNVKRTVLKSVVGTLDLRIQQTLHGEAFPGELVKAPLFGNTGSKRPKKYGYVANLCVAKSARRQGIANNMLLFAIRTAKSNGAEQVFVHVHRNNTPAQKLYEKMGFKVVETANPQLSAEQTYLLCLNT